MFHGGLCSKLHHSTDLVGIRLYARVHDAAAEEGEITQTELTFIEL